MKSSLKYTKGAKDFSEADFFYPDFEKDQTKSGECAYLMFIVVYSVDCRAVESELCIRVQHTCRRVLP
jgi:hypothetical protein